MLHAKFKIIRLLVLEKKIFKGFYHIWAWRPSWSCDLDHLYKLSFPFLKEAPHTIWLWLAKRFQRRRCLNIVDDDNDNGRQSMGILLAHLVSLRLRWAKNKNKWLINRTSACDQHRLTKTAPTKSALLFKINVCTIAHLHAYEYLIIPYLSYAPL